MKAKAKYGPAIYQPGNDFNRDSNGNFIGFDSEKAMREYWKRKLAPCKTLSYTPTGPADYGSFDRQWNSYHGWGMNQMRPDFSSVPSSFKVIAGGCIQFDQFPAKYLI